MISKTERRICGTCEYWTGKREPVFDKKGIPKVSMDDQSGECENESSRFCEQPRDRSSSCVKYSKWTEIL